MRAIVVEVLGQHSMLVGVGRVSPDTTRASMEKVEACVRYSQQSLGDIARAARATGMNFFAYSKGLRRRVT